MSVSKRNDGRETAAGPVDRVVQLEEEKKKLEREYADLKKKIDWAISTEASRNELAAIRLFLHLPDGQSILSRLRTLRSLAGIAHSQIDYFYPEHFQNHGTREAMRILKILKDGSFIG